MQPIKTALCSFGMSGWVFHAPFIDAHPGFEFIAVYERTSNHAEKKYPDVKTYRSLEAMLAVESIELVIVNTPNYTHFTFAKACLEAGKHVIVEKPFTLNVDEADTLISLASKQNKKLSVFQNRRWDSDFQTVQDVVQKKLLGNIVEVEFHFDRFKEDLSPKAHKEVPGPGTGLLYDLGSHLIDQALQLFGMPLRVFADVSIVRSVSKVEDYMELLLFYGSSMRVRLKASYQVKEMLPSYILHGSNGSFIKSRADIQEANLQAKISPLSPNWGIEPDEAKGLLHVGTAGDDTRGYIPSYQGNYMVFYDGIYRAIRAGGVLPVTAEEGKQVIQIIEAAYKSVSSGCIVIV